MPTSYYTRDQELEQASSGHQFIGKLLAQPPFLAYRIRQEYPVQLINPSWHSGRHKFDWVILDLKLVIEVHGAQHSQPVRWSNDISQDEAIAALENRQRVDWQKQRAAEEAGWGYIAIPQTLIDQGQVTRDWLVQALTAVLKMIS